MAHSIGAAPVGEQPSGRQEAGQKAAGAVNGAGAGSPAKAQESATPDALRQWGLETLGRIQSDFWLPERSLYADEIAVGKPAPNNPAFMWGCGVQLTALVAAAELDRTNWETPLRRYVASLDSYWIEGKGVGGYDVIPKAASLDRYYDDNEWIVLGLCEVYDLLPEAQYRERAVKTMQFVLSGQDDSLGGGIYWHEQDRNSKNTCSNGPAAAAALRLYQITHERKYLGIGLRLYDWTRAHLQDVDSLYFDNIKLDGRVEKTKWSYNTALMLRAGCLLYSILHDPAYLTEAQRVGHAAVAHWFQSDTGAISDGGAFAHLLCEALLALYEQDHDPQWLSAVQRALGYVHADVRAPNGWYGENWSKPQIDDLTKVKLLTEAAVARAFLHAAAYSANAKP
jgi:rhamnogalacturonyl hydrolase YesR